MTPPISHNRFNSRLYKMVETVSGDASTEELVRFMEAPNSKLNGERPWDLLAWAEDEDFQRCLGALNEWVEEKRSGRNPSQGTRGTKEGCGGGRR
jgi:hypothetical protein